MKLVSDYSKIVAECFFNFIYCITNWLIGYQLVKLPGYYYQGSYLKAFFVGISITNLKRYDKEEVVLGLILAGILQLFQATNYTVCFTKL